MRSSSRAVAALAAVAVLLLVTLASAKVPAFHYPANDPYVTTVTSQTFRDKVVDPTMPVVLNFYSPKIKACRPFGDVYLKAAELLHHYANFTAVDASTEDGKALSQMFGVNSVPGTLLFNPEMLPVQGGQEGQFMKMPLVFGGQPTVAHLTQFVFEGTAGTDITILEDLDDYKEFVDEFRMMEIPKIILVTSQTFTSPAFKAVSHAYRYGALFGVVHAASVKEALLAAKGDNPAAVSLKGELLAHLGVGVKFTSEDSLPLIAYATAIQDVPEVLSNVGHMTLEDLKVAIGKIAWPEAKRKESMSFFLEDANNRRKREAAEAKKVKPQPVVIAYDAASWESSCTKRKRGTCAAIFVENPDDEKLVAWLNSAAKQLSQRSTTVVQFVVTPALQNPNLATFFGATDMGFPTAVFINPTRKMYWNLVGSFSERGVTNYYMDRVEKGKGKAYDPSKTPEYQISKEEEEEAAAAAAEPAQAGDDTEIIVEDL